MDYHDPSQRQYARQSFPGLPSSRAEGQSTGQEGYATNLDPSNFVPISHEQSTTHPRSASATQIYSLTQGTQYAATHPAVSTPELSYNVGMQFPHANPQQGGPQYASNLMYTITPPQQLQQQQHLQQQQQRQQQQPQQSVPHLSQPSYAQATVPQQRHSASQALIEPYGQPAGAQYASPVGTFAVSSAMGGAASTSYSVVYEPRPSTTRYAIPSPGPTTGGLPHTDFTPRVNPGYHAAVQIQSMMQPSPSQTSPLQAETRTGYARQPSQLSAPTDSQIVEYDTQVCRIFQLVREDRLKESGALLEVVSRFLISHALSLGYHRDDQDQHAARLKMWQDFNNAWLVTLQRQYDLSSMLRSNARMLHETSRENIISLSDLTNLINDLIALNDSIETAGLVDYEMGVREDEIVSLAVKCCDILSQIESNAPAAPTLPQAESSTQASKRKKRG